MIQVLGYSGVLMILLIDINYNYTMLSMHLCKKSSGLDLKTGTDKLEGCDHQEAVPEPKLF